MKLTHTQYGKLPLAIDAQGRAKMVRGGVEGHAFDDGANAGAPNQRTIPVGRHARSGPKPVSSPAPSPTFDSKDEADYATYLEGLKLGGDIVDYVHHPWSFLLPGGVKYTPDFLVISEIDPRMVLPLQIALVEIKGHHANMRDSITRVKIARGLFPWFPIRLIYRKKRKWLEKWPL